MTDWRVPVPPRPLLVILGLLVGAGGLVLQFAVSVPTMLGSGRDLPGALGSFFSYYTILTNAVLVLIYLSELVPASWLALWRHPVTRGLMLANMALVGLFVFFVLRHLYALEGLSLLADNMLHYLSPLLYLLFWVFMQRHGALDWRALPVMLAPTFIYFLFILARGAWVGEYPYAIIDVGEFGCAQVLLNALCMTAGLAILCIAAIAADHLLARKSRTVLQ